VPRKNGNSAPKPSTDRKLSSSAQKLVNTIKANIISEQYTEYVRRLWAAWSGGTITGEDAAIALSSMTEPDPDIAERNALGYLTSKL